MSLKEELINIREMINESIEEAKSNKVSKKNTSIDLNDKVDEFIDWYFNTMVKGNSTDTGEYRYPREMRDLIEKIAVWYELRYPSYEVNRLMPGSGQEEIDINDIMFRNNCYINDTKELKWNDFYNTNVFIKSLPWEERCYFCKPRYRYIVYLNSDISNAHLKLTRNGFIKSAEDVTEFTKSIIRNKELIGLNIREVVKLFKEKGIKLPKDNELGEAITCVDNSIKQKEGMLDCVMYRIIERGGNRIGPRRAFLFAKEFGRNIDIPMMYAIDYSDPGLRLFINEYIKSGGSKDLNCYIGYFSRTNKKEKLKTVTIQELILTLYNNAATFYTPEEHELHQRLVNVLANQVDYEKVKEIKK